MSVAALTVSVTTGAPRATRLPTAPLATLGASGCLQALATLGDATAIGAGAAGLGLLLR